MKAMWIAGTCVGLGLMIGAGTTHACAQAEIDPDHYETTEVAHPQATATIRKTPAVHYEGVVVVPYGLECRDKKLEPGQYSLLLNSDGKATHLSLQHGRQVLRLDALRQGRGANPGPDALVIERSGRTHKLSLIHVAQMDFFFDADPSFRQPSRARAGSMEQLPITGNGTR